MGEKTVIDDYLEKVYTIVLVVIAGAGLCAGLTFASLKALGLYSKVPWVGIIVLLFTTIIYLIISIIFIKYRNDEHGRLKKSMIAKAKIFLFILCTIHWNFILFMIPSRDFWAFSFIFLILPALFLDNRLNISIVSGYCISLVIAWIIKGETLLPVKDELFVA